MKNIKYLIVAGLLASIATPANAAVTIPGGAYFGFDFETSVQAGSGTPSVNNGSGGWTKYGSEIPTLRAYP